MKVTTLKRYCLIKAKTGVHDLGSEWPARAMMAPSMDRYALTFPLDDRKPVVEKRLNLIDSVEHAQRELCNGVQSCAVNRVSGKFGQSNLYEEIIRFSKDSAPSLKHITRDPDLKSMWADITSTTLMGQSEGDPIKISGMASVDTMDRDFDIVEATAFDEDIQNFLNNPLLLWNHSTDMPVGRVEEVEQVTDGSLKGLRFVALVTDEQMKRWISDKLINSVSIGFRIKDREFKEPEHAPDGTMVAPGVMIIKRLELMEISLVTLPAQASARFEVVKSFGSQTSEPSPTTCELPRGNIGYRGLPVADLNDPFDLNGIGKAFGEDFDRHCHAFEDQPGEYTLPTAGVVDGELKTVPMLVRLSMAQIVARDHDMTDEQRMMAWSHVGKRWMDCFPEEPVPAIDKAPSPGLFGSVLKGSLLDVPYAYIPDTVEKRWAEDRGLPCGEKSAPVDGARQFELSRGVRIYVKALHSKPAQMVVVSKSRFKKQADAEAWAEARGFFVDHWEETCDSFKYQQFESASGKAGTFDTVELEDGISTIVCERQEQAMKTKQEGEDDKDKDDDTTTEPKPDQDDGDDGQDPKAPEEDDKTTDGDSAEGDTEVEVDSRDIAVLEDFAESGEVSDPAAFERALENIGEANKA